MVSSWQVVGLAAAFLLSGVMATGLALRDALAGASSSHHRHGAVSSSMAVGISHLADHLARRGWAPITLKGESAAGMMQSTFAVGAAAGVGGKSFFTRRPDTLQPIQGYEGFGVAYEQRLLGAQTVLHVLSVQGEQTLARKFEETEIPEGFVGEFANNHVHTKGDQMIEAAERARHFLKRELRVDFELVRSRLTFAEGAPSKQAPLSNLWGPMRTSLVPSLTVVGGLESGWSLVLRSTEGIHFQSYPR